jgi:ABC-2 type transport system permease protein
MTLMFIFGPIIGLALGFDAISKERTSGSLSVLLSQPIFRDSVINGKFLAGITALSLMVVSTVGIMVGLAIPIVGFGPTLAETSRIMVFTLLTVLYLGFWLALSLLFSTAFKKTTTSILATVSTWIFFTFAITIIAALIATALVPVPAFPSFRPVVIVGNQTGPITMPDQTLTQAYSDASQRRYALQAAIQNISPSNLYTQASSALLIGISISPYSSSSNASIVSTWPQILAIGVGLVICFAGAYVLFLRREIRPGG